jgi:hypothetical protein
MTTRSMLLRNGVNQGQMGLWLRFGSGMDPWISRHLRHRYSYSGECPRNVAIRLLRMERFSSLVIAFTR